MTLKLRVLHTQIQRIAFQCDLWNSKCVLENWDQNTQKAVNRRKWHWHNIWLIIFKLFLRVIVFDVLKDFLDIIDKSQILPPVINYILRRTMIQIYHTLNLTLMALNPRSENIQFMRRFLQKQWWQKIWWKWLLLDYITLNNESEKYHLHFMLQICTSKNAKISDYCIFGSFATIFALFF